MSIMCSTVTKTGLVTFDLGIGPNGRSIYRVSWWNGVKWCAKVYRSFEAALKTYKMISQMI